MTLSAEEWLMSLSCQSVMFSIAVSAYPLKSLLMPEIRSQRIGFRLWGMALDPFCVAPNGSSTSMTSVLWRWRISVANLSRAPPRSAMVFITQLWRSR